MGPTGDAAESGLPEATSLERAVANVAAREEEVRAWVHLDADGARHAAANVAAAAGDLPLRGLILGVKDIFDTADAPTAYGCSLYAGYRPRADAAAVAMLRAAGAVCLGKTVTTELAMFHPGPTTNPWRVTHTPGGSSSGSAAAVAAGMADIALGTQTAGSVIRPASFCGVWGFKPTFGSVSTAGVKAAAPTLDTVGWFARSARDVDAVRVVLSGQPPRPSLGPPRIGLARTAQWETADDDCREAVEAAARLAREAGASVVDTSLPSPIEELTDAHQTIQAFESARAYTYERLSHPDALSEMLRDILGWGAAISAVEYEQVRRRTLRARGESDALFGDVDVLLTPGVIGEAPAGLESTGDPRFARLWTALGLPALSVPGLRGATGLPIGVQLVGRWGGDGIVLAAGEWLGRVLASTD